MFSLSSGKYSEIELLERAIAQSLVSWGLSRLSPLVVVPIYIFTKNPWVFTIYVTNIFSSFIIYLLVLIMVFWVAQRFFYAFVSSDSSSLSQVNTAFIHTQFINNHQYSYYFSLGPLFINYIFLRNYPFNLDFQFF